jgi:hypothetical protein
MAIVYLNTINAVDYEVEGVELGEAKGFLSVDRTEIDHTDSPYLATSDDELIRVDPSTAAVIINLPAAVDNLVIGIKNITNTNTNEITINPNGIETIDLFTSIGMKSKNGFLWLSGIAGTGWEII